MAPSGDSTVNDSMTLVIYNLNRHTVIIKLNCFHSFRTEETLRSGKTNRQHDLVQVVPL